MNKICKVCKNEYPRKKKSTYKEYEKSLYCSRLCKGKATSLRLFGNKYGKGWVLGKRHTINTIKKISEYKLKNPTRYWLGKKRSPETIEKMREFGKSRVGEKAPRWISDRSLLKESIRQSGHKYRIWRESVFKRDNYKCFFYGAECRGKLEAHHILRWKDFFSLRYEVKNGISVCHFHHPRKIKDEKDLIATFSELSGLQTNFTK